MWAFDVNAPGSDAEFSWNGGASWKASKSDGAATASEHTGVLGSASDGWGRAWTAAEASDATFRVRLTASSTVARRDFFLDWAAVRVTYGP